MTDYGLKEVMATIHGIYRETKNDVTRDKLTIIMMSIIDNAIPDSIDTEEQMFAYAKKMGIE